MEASFPANFVITELDKARQAGVQRGINASIQALEELRSRHNKRSSGYNDLSMAINKLQALTINQVEG
jgi:hypothetical protein